MTQRFSHSLLLGLWLLLTSIPGRALLAQGPSADSLRTALKEAHGLRGKGQFEEARLRYEAILTAAMDGRAEPDTFAARVQMDIGLIHFLSGSYEEGLEACQGALAAFRAADGVRAQDTMECFFRIGIHLRELGDLHRAEDYMLASLAVAETEDPDNARHLGRCHNALGNIALREQAFGRATGHYLRAQEELGKALGMESVHLGALSGNLGVAYMSMDSLDKAIASHLRALEIFEKKLPPRHPTIGNTYVNLGEAYLAANDLAASEAWLQRAADFWKVHLAPGHVNHVILLNDFAALERKKGRLKKALGYSQEALETLAPGFDGSDWHADPHPDSCRYEEELMNVWLQKAGIIAELHQMDSSAFRMEDARNLYWAISDLVDKMRQGFRRESSQLFLSGRSLPAFEEAIALAWANGRGAGEAFRFAEKSKAVLLYGAVKGRELKDFAGVPPKMLGREAALKEELQRINQAIDEAEADSTAYRDLLRQRLAQQGMYEALMDSFGRQYPDYFKLKYDHQVMDIPAVQAALQQRKAGLIAYFWGDEHLYGWAVLPGGLRFQRLGSREDASELIGGLLDRVEARQPMGELPHEAYLLLLEPLLRGEATPDRLVIVRDGLLEYLPFALLRTAPGKARGDYLVQGHALSYASSATVLFRPHAPAAPANGYMGFAMGFPGGMQVPEALRAQALGALPFARKEVESGRRIFGGEGRFDEGATEQDFRREAGGRGILHLATHTLIDDRNPLYSRLVLSAGAGEDGFLHTYELFGMDLDAELVVLSACNTGRGALQRGEGMMSLSRGFAYAGCPSILMTHWTVSDRQNAGLMEAFFKGLAKGLPKDKALQQAQVDYLAAADEITGHPWYWAAPGLLGDAVPLEMEGSGSGSWIWLLLGLGGLGFGLWRWGWSKG